MYKLGLRVTILAFIAMFLFSCNGSVRKSQTKYAPSSMIIIVESYYGTERVLGEVEIQNRCISYLTFLKGVPVKRFICSDFVVTGYENNPVSRKKLKIY